jgi:hypothetical protein
MAKPQLTDGVQGATARPLRGRSRPLLVGFAIAVIVAGASAYSSGHRAAASPVDPQLSDLANRYFSSTTNMHLAGTPTSLWAAVLGIPHRGHTISAHVFTRTVDRSWSALPAPPGRVGAGVRFQVADNVGRPCLKYVDDRARPRVPCWTGRRWRELKLGGAFSARLTPSDLTSFRRRPTILLYDDTTLRVVRWTGQAWVRLGSDFHVSVRRPHFGLATDGSLTLGFDATRARRRVRSAWVFRSARWRHVTDVVLHGSGPSQSGPVIDHLTAFTAVVDARGTDWPFYAVIASGHHQQNVAGSSLNEGPGAAQGSAGTAGGQAWAIWQQNAQRRDGLFDTRIVLRSIDLAHVSAGPSRTLWTGVSNGPGDLQVLDALGTSWVAYMPAQTSSKREIAIEPLLG